MKIFSTLLLSLCLATTSYAAPNRDMKAKAFYNCEDWRAYGFFMLDPYAASDNPKCNLLGLRGESRLPYTVPDGYELVITYMQIEGPDSPQVGMMLWLGDFPCTNEKSLMSCTTPAGSVQMHGMELPIPAGQTINLRIMNNTGVAWVNNFYIEGFLHKLPVNEWGHVWEDNYDDTDLD
jgi:hypothetical protein